MKNEETAREMPRDNAEVRMQKACHSAIGGKPSTFSLQPSAFLHAFTLLEVMIATALFGLVVAGTIEVYIMCNKLWHATSLSMQTSRESSLALSRVIYGMGTNNGLRSASMILLLTNNVYGHPYPFADTNKYWENGATPPAAASSLHYTHAGCGYGADGSWRLIISNGFDGVQCVDYNSKMRNILFCPDTNQTTAARQKRLLICNYVSAASVTTNAGGTIGIQLTVEKRDGAFISSNTVSTSVKMRNKP
jgi:prepilin-type N-terminal cleavage/methylation domain-containing protein